MTEPKYNILASSLDNFYVFDNSEAQENPYVEFKVVGQNRDCTITIEDEDNSDGLRYILKGLANESGDFNTSTSTSSLRYSLVACLEKYPIFYNIQMIGSNSVRASIDTAIKYKITSSNSSIIQVGGTYASYKVSSIPKFRIEVKVDGGSTFTLEKATRNRQVSFNITSPFQYMMSRYPIDITVNAYKIGKVGESIQLGDSRLTIMPTTLSKFNDVNFENYHYYGGKRTSAFFLTTLREKTTNYNEIHALSLLSDFENLTIRKKYYTNGGRFLCQEDGHLLRQYNSRRLDFYFDLNLNRIEAEYNHQVGYVEVVAVQNGKEVTMGITYRVNPNCNEGETLFFVNRLGGVESFTFYGEMENSSKIKAKTSTYTIPIDKYNGEYKYEFIHSKRTEDVYKLSCDNISTNEAKWLKDLQRSKCVWLSTDDTFEFTNIIIDKFDISISNRDKLHSLTLEYYKSDDNINY